MEFRALSDKLRLLQAKTPEVSLSREICLRVTTAMIRQCELSGIPEAL